MWIGAAASREKRPPAQANGAAERPAATTATRPAMKEPGERTVYVVLTHADDHGRDICGIYSTEKKARRAVLKIALDDEQRCELHHIATVEVDAGGVIDWMGPGR